MSKEVFKSMKVAAGRRDGTKHQPECPGVRAAWVPGRWDEGARRQEWKRRELGVLTNNQSTGALSSAARNTHDFEARTGEGMAGNIRHVTAHLYLGEPINPARNNTP